MERLSFLQKVPTLMKATADDENPCPGYLFQEISKISHESLGCGQCLLEYLLERLQVKSCHVKLKAIYSGPPDPIHGTALYQRVRTTAQEVARLLFTDTTTIKNSIPANSTANQTMGMGSAKTNKSGMQGFGYNPGKQGSVLLDKIQKAAEVVASAVLPPTEHQGIRLYDNHYQVAVPACSYNLPVHKSKVAQRNPGQIGGGWEETDSANSSSCNSSQDISAHCRASIGRGSTGTGSQSGASRESSGDLSERSTTLNCEVVVELLAKKLHEASDTIKMRTMCALACLMTSDLLSLEQIYVILRQFEAMTRGSHNLHKKQYSRSSDHATNNVTATCTDSLEVTHPAQVPQALAAFIPHPFHEAQETTEAEVGDEIVQANSSTLSWDIHKADSVNCTVQWYGTSVKVQACV
ncbi:hypothetical protein WMY93_011088 [Mugilogobius chulae]|uniref:AP-4 complex accessory subunit Tepsin VHS/ENTH-like domain-containing protein n=1 Tax=Mugilogobius chulae TaxID=88201 RepID=A0AAW0PI70_9GOBI